MYYSLIEDSGNGLILRRNLTLKILYWLILVLGILFLLPGLLLILDPDTGITANFFLGFGLVFFAGAILLNDMRKKIPEVIEFLNKEQVVKIRGNYKEHIFSYNEIEHFFTHGRNGYTICLMKKDGSIWDLMSLNSSKAVEKKLSLLREKIKIRPETILPEIKYLLPPSFQKHENAGEIYFYWKEKEVGKQLLMVFLMVAGFGSMLGSSLKGSDYHTIFLIGYPCLILLIAAYFIYTVIIAHTKYSMLLFDILNISYGQGKISTSNLPHDFKASKKMAVSELDSVRYSFDGHQSFFYSIMFLDKETLEGINQMEGENSPGLMDFSLALKTYSHLFKFNISGKDVIDIANFAALLKQSVREKYKK
jgi:hypothetical protein